MARTCRGSRQRPAWRRPAPCLRDVRLKRGELLHPARVLRSRALVDDRCARDRSDRLLRKHHVRNPLIDAGRHGRFPSSDAPHAVSAPNDLRQDGAADGSRATDDDVQLRAIPFPRSSRGPASGFEQGAQLIGLHVELHAERLPGYSSQRMTLPATVPVSSERLLRFPASLPQCRVAERSRCYSFVPRREQITRRSTLPGPTLGLQRIRRDSPKSAALPLSYGRTFTLKESGKVELAF